MTDLSPAKLAEAKKACDGAPHWNDAIESRMARIYELGRNLLPALIDAYEELKDRLEVLESECSKRKSD